MIIKEIQVDGFGVFNGFALTDLREGINVVCGENEAGKSTLLKFLRYTLFGYPRSTKDRMQPVNGGDHGGRILGVLADGHLVSFSRKGGGTGGEIEARRNGTATTDKSEWHRMLGGASEKLFGNIYAISLEELQSIDSLSESGVDDKIFSVGLGIGNASLKKVQEELQKQADSIWSQRGTTKEIHEIVERLSESKRRLAVIQDDLAKYAELKRSLDGFQQEAARYDLNMDALSRKAADLATYLKCQPDHNALADITRSFETLPARQLLPADGVEKLKKLEHEEKLLLQQIENINNGNERETGIGEIRNRLATFSVNGPLLDHADSLEYLERNLEKYRQTMAEYLASERKMSAIEASIEMSLAKIGGGWTRDVVATYDDFTEASIQINSHKTNLSEAKMRVVRAESDDRARRAVPPPKSSAGVWAFVAAAALVVVAAYLFYLSLTVFAVIALVVGVLLPVAAGLFVPQPVPEVEDDELKQAVEAEKAIKERYFEYVSRNLYFDGSVDPDLVLQRLNLVNQTKKEIVELREMSNKQLGERKPFISEFEHAAAVVRGANRPGDSIISEVERALKEHASAKEQLAERQSFERLLTEGLSKLERHGSELLVIRNAIASLIASVGAADRADFFQRYETNRRIEALELERDQRVASIERIAGGADKYLEVAGFLEAHDKYEIEHQIEAVRQELANVSEERAARYIQRGATEAEIGRMEGETEHAAVMTEIETEKAKLAAAFDRWTANKVAIELLQQVKRKYEHEKQPDVLKNSSAFFHAITNGRYTRVNANLDDREIEVSNGQGVSKKIHQLSRGTKEQLLISMRLGFIEEYEKEAEPLPVIVDDVFVHFDPARAKAAARVFHEFAKGRQVLIFSCHETTQQFFGDLPVNVVKLERNTGVIAAAGV